MFSSTWEVGNSHPDVRNDKSLHVDTHVPKQNGGILAVRLDLSAHSLRDLGMPSFGLVPFHPGHVLSVLPCHPSLAALFHPPWFPLGPRQCIRPHRRTRPSNNLATAVEQKKTTVSQNVTVSDQQQTFFTLLLMPTMIWKSEITKLSSFFSTPPPQTKASHQTPVGSLDAKNVEKN